MKRKDKKIKLPIICKTESNAPLIISNIKPDIVLLQIVDKQSKER